MGVVVHTLPPVYDQSSLVLILGTITLRFGMCLPLAKSRAQPTQVSAAPWQTICGLFLKQRPSALC